MRYVVVVLPRARRADERDELARLGLEVDVLEPEGRQELDRRGRLVRRSPRRRFAAVASRRRLAASVGHRVEGRLEGTASVG